MLNTQYHAGATDSWCTSARSYCGEQTAAAAEFGDQADSGVVERCSPAARSASASVQGARQTPVNHGAHSRTLQAHELYTSPLQSNTVLSQPRAAQMPESPGSLTRKALDWLGGEVGFIVWA